MPAIAVPLLADKVDAWKAWIEECTGPRAKEFDAYNRRMGLTLHRVWLTEGPTGPLAIVNYEGPGAGTMLATLAGSDHPFDTWFRDSISEFHGQDFSQVTEAPPSAMHMDWNPGESTMAGKS